jgi:DNA-binding NtrC family response regulator
MMPKGINGIELARRAKEMRPGIKVLLTSGDVGPNPAAEEIARNRFRFLPKPFRQAELAAALRQLLGSPA